MGRGKLKMELIADEKSRKITFKKRKDGILKKCLEFSTLCAIDVGMIIYGPKQIGRPAELETYPKERREVDRIIKQFQTSTMFKPPKRVVTLSDIFVERKRKIDAEISKLRKEYYAAKYPIPDDMIDSLDKDQLVNLKDKLDSKIDHLKKAIDLRREKNPQHHPTVHTENPMRQNLRANYVVQNMQLQNNMQLHVLLNQYQTQTFQQIPRCFDSSPAVNVNNPMMMMMMNNHQHGLENGASSSNGNDHHHHHHHQCFDGCQHLCGPVYDDQQVGIVDNMMLSNVNCGGSSMAGQYAQLVQMQQPMPYVQFNQTVNNAAGVPSLMMNGSDDANRFDNEFEYLYKNKIFLDGNSFSHQ